ncbi:hypothetical protein RchiOBHm_Chr3g0488371 [Rosa chinensis]|uniref:Uncharacterized protein n=1 Tax=Rosa chinensis TaxID=74649 RepID=A0A2P6RFQ7_ROSCH|nr:hypothetical protein RchiOBHm_Chr3g0488371 [Rosa chinensis]
MLFSLQIKNSHEFLFCSLGNSYMNLNSVLMLTGTNYRAWLDSVENIWECMRI